MSTRKLSSGFASTTTRGMTDFNKEVESRLSQLDVFTDDFSPPGTSESVPGQDYNKRSAPYEKPHDDFAPETEDSFWNKKSLHSAGDPKDQEKMDWLDGMANSLEAPIKNPYDQFPGTVDMEDHKEETRFNDALTDPRRLSRMSKQIYKDVTIDTFDAGGGRWKARIDDGDEAFEINAYFGSNADAMKAAKREVDQMSSSRRGMSAEKVDGPESFNRAVEKKLKQLSVSKPGDKTGVEEDPKPKRDPKYNSGKNEDQEQ